MIPIIQTIISAPPVVPNEAMWDYRIQIENYIDSKIKLINKPILSFVFLKYDSTLSSLTVTQKLLNPVKMTDEEYNDCIESLGELLKVTEEIFKPNETNNSDSNVQSE